MLYTPRFLAVTLANFFVACNIGTFYLFPLFLSDHGGTPADIGYIMGAFPLASVLSRPFVSKAINRFGRKRSYVTFALVMSAISLAYLIFSGELRSFYLPLLVVRAIHGICGGLTFTAGFTYAADIIPPNRMNEGLGMYGASGLIGFAIGPALAEAIITQYGFSTCFLAAAALPILGFLCLLFLPESYVHGRSEPSESFFQVLRQTKIFIAAILVLILGVGVASTSSFVSLFALSRGLAFVSAYFLAYSGAAVAMRLVGGRLADRVGETRIIPYALVLCGVGLIVLIFTYSTAVLLVAGLISGAAHGLLFPSLNTMAVRNEPAGLRAQIMAIVTGAFDAGTFVGSIALGQIGKYFGFPTLFLVAGLVFFVGLAIIRVRPLSSSVPTAK